MKHSYLQFLGRWSGAIVPGLVVPALILAASSPLFATGEEQFSSAEAAVQALTSAAKSKDTNSLHAIFGPMGHELVSPDIVQATNEREVFMDRLTEKINLVRESDSKSVLQLGADAWPFPIPLVKQNGQWFFDSGAGKEEILNRRIGANELGAIAVCHAYVDAQRDYASVDRNGDEVLEYAQQLRSTPGTHDGLYWPAQSGGELSPLGPLIAQTHIEGYRQQNRIMTEDQSPYHGYYFKVLTRQGRDAPGGKYSYIINGHMIGGFALVAWPAQWGNSGVMTFIVNQQGKVYERNLGEKTPKIVALMTEYNPDARWKPVGD